MKQRVYKCFDQKELIYQNFRLIPIRDKDKFAIMEWRNDQIDVLRQKEPLTKDKQEWYFSNIVDGLFEQEKPDQLLFSLLENNQLIGYGGLVHIDWESKNGEISFLTGRERSTKPEIFLNDWKIFLRLLIKLGGEYLKFNKIYTYAYDIRPLLYQALIESSFTEEARLKNHISIHGTLRDILIHAYQFSKIVFRSAHAEDAILYFNWVSDPDVKRNSFDQTIEWDDHKDWFTHNVNSSKCLLFIAYQNENAIGQIGYEEVQSDVFEINFLIDKNWRGKGMGGEILKWGTRELISKRPQTKKVIGNVKSSNFASMKLFEIAGFKHQEVSGEDGMHVYYLDGLGS